MAQPTWRDPLYLGDGTAFYLTSTSLKKMNLFQIPSCVSFYDASTPPQARTRTFVVLSIRPVVRSSCRPALFMN